MSNKPTLERAQPFRAHYSSVTSPSVRESEVVYIATYRDDVAGKDIVLWEDILSVFKDIEYVRDGENSIPFLRDAEDKFLEPRRIQANQDNTYDVETKY
ncbi:hypothetical protein BGZ76_001977 [Entomortierella beljakovae]|nr:hypothetical protein BGZ76_001977 [Entomortierella beljakovae]